DKGIRKPRPVDQLRLRPLPSPVDIHMRILPSKDGLEVNFVPSYSVYDGRYAMNPWLQELPDPITKLVWDNAAIISPLTAEQFKLKTGDVAKLGYAAVGLEIPVFVLPGHADWCVTLSFGHFGEMRIGRVPDGGGTNVFPLRTSAAMHQAMHCTIDKLGSRVDLVTTQEHGVIPQGRDIIHEHDVNCEPKASADERSADRAGFQAGYGNTQQLPGPVREKQQRFPLDLARPELLDSQFQWGMVIDLSACTGCSACMIACQSENNIPV